jgi:hypothetical protein
MGRICYKTNGWGKEGSCLRGRLLNRKGGRSLEGLMCVYTGIKGRIVVSVIIMII